MCSSTPFDPPVFFSIDSCVIMPSDISLFLSNWYSQWPNPRPYDWLIDRSFDCIQTAEVDEVIRELKLIPGFSSYVILNNDGIVIKYENMSYKDALHHAHQVLGLTGKATKYIRDLFEAHENEVRWGLFLREFHSIVHIYMRLCHILAVYSL